MPSIVQREHLRGDSAVYTDESCRVTARRALTWLKHFVEFLWQECSIAVMVYGVFRSEDGSAQGVRCVHQTRAILDASIHPLDLDTTLRNWCTTATVRMALSRDSPRMMHGR